ncbi:hypothetical protein ABZ342_34890 [Amycolatopsis sp. NPDC005961]|uniref:hypothetical protein n=1 Tax=Amycolatopsis sp. NPDC005961 TaxID=3156720 RepID=UPI0033E37E0C
MYTRRGQQIFTFDVLSGHLTTETDLAGSKASPPCRTTLVYDADGNLTDVYGVGTTRTPSLKDDDHYRYGYAAGHVLTSVRTPANFSGPASAVTSMVYDGSERVRGQTDPDGATTTFTYGPDGGFAAGQTLVTDSVIAGTSPCGAWWATSSAGRGPMWHTRSPP